jgi:hypothetical protein
MGLDMSDPEPKNKSGESKYRVSVPGILGSSLRDMFYDKERDMNLFNLGDVQHLLVRAAKQQKAISSLGQYQDNFQLPDLPGATQ